MSQKVSTLLTVKVDDKDLLPWNCLPIALITKAEDMGISTNGHMKIIWNAFQSWDIILIFWIFAEEWCAFLFLLPKHLLWVILFDKQSSEDCTCKHFNSLPFSVNNTKSSPFRIIWTLCSAFWQFAGIHLPLLANLFPMIGTKLTNGITNHRNTAH